MISNLELITQYFKMTYKQKGWPGWLEKIPVLGPKIKKIKKAKKVIKANKNKK